jgi:hypothetical protein
MEWKVMGFPWFPDDMMQNARFSISLKISMLVYWKGKLISSRKMMLSTALLVISHCDVDLTQLHPA